MKLNCKPGDMAFIIREGRGPDWYCGRIVEVLHAAPTGRRFELPDGYAHESIRRGRVYWVCKFQSPVKVARSDGARMTIYAPLPDDALHPIRPNEGEDETLTWAGKPEKVTA